MSKTSFILLIILLIVIGALVRVFSLPTDTLLPSFTNRPLHQGAKQVVTSENTLSLVARPIAGQIVYVDVLLNAPLDAPNLVQLEIGYESDVLTAIDITQGNFFTTSNVLLNLINPPIGRISYALKCSSQNEADCINHASEKIATITFRINPTAKKQTTLKLLPKTLLRNKDEQEMLLKTQDAKIILPSIAIPVATESGVINGSTSSP